MRTLKFKTKLTITFYSAVNHYRNGLQKQKQANGSKSANHEPGAWPVDLSETSHLFPERSTTWLTAASTSNLLPLHQSHCYPLQKFHFPWVSPGDQTADQGAWGLWVRDWMIFRSFRKRNNSQKNTNTVYSEYSYSGIVPKERALSKPFPLMSPPFGVLVFCPSRLGSLQGKTSTQTSHGQAGSYLTSARSRQGLLKLFDSLSRGSLICIFLSGYVVVLSRVVRRPINNNPGLTVYKNYTIPWQLNLDNRINDLDPLLIWIRAKHASNNTGLSSNL